MAVQSTQLKSTVAQLESKAEEYEKRTNIETKVEQARKNIDSLNSTLKKLERNVENLEKQAGVLHKVFDKSLPDSVGTARDKVRDTVSVPQKEIIDIVDDNNQDLTAHTEEVRDVGDKADLARRAVNDQIKDIQEEKQAKAKTARNIQRILGEDREAMKTIDRYESFVKSALSPRDSVSYLKSEWQGVEKAFENLDTDWEGFQRHHGLRSDTIEDLITLSNEGDVSLSELSSQSISEMMDVDKLRSSINVSL